MVTGTGGAKVACTRTGKGTLLWRTRTPRQSIGISTLPAVSTVKRTSGADALQVLTRGTGGGGGTQTAETSFANGRAVKWANAPLAGGVPQAPSFVKKSSTQARSPGCPTQGALAS